jgi:hypothetical protein
LTTTNFVAHISPACRQTAGSWFWGQVSAELVDSIWSSRLPCSIG